MNNTGNATQEKAMECMTFNVLICLGRSPSPFLCIGITNYFTLAMLIINKYQVPKYIFYTYIDHFALLTRADGDVKNIKYSLQLYNKLPNTKYTF